MNNYATSCKNKGNADLVDKIFLDYEFAKVFEASLDTAATNKNI